MHPNSPNVLSPQWTVAAGYGLRDGRLQITNSKIVRTWNPADEACHGQLLRQWLSIRLETDLLDFVETYGLPNTVSNEMVVRKAGSSARVPAQKISVGKPGVSTTDLIEQARAMCMIWKLYKIATDNPYALENYVFPFLDSDGFPGKQYRKRPGKSAAKIIVQTPGLGEEELLKVGRKNTGEFKQGRNPFLEQARQVRLEYIAAFGEEPPEYFSDANLCDVRIRLPESVVGYGSISMPASQWMDDWVKAAQYAAYTFVCQHLTEMMRHLVHQAVVEIGSELRINSCVIIETPMDALKLALFKEVTRSSLLELCPHPTCGKLFLRTRKDKSSCGAERCQKFVTVERKKRQFRANIMSGIPAEM